MEPLSLDLAIKIGLILSWFFSSLIASLLTIAYDAKREPTSLPTSLFLMAFLGTVALSHFLVYMFLKLLNAL